MPYTQIRRPVGTVSGLQDGSDGSRLLDLFAAQATVPSRSTVKNYIRGTPGFSVGAQVHASDSCRTMFVSESATYGEHLFVLTDNNLYVYSDFVSGVSSDTLTLYSSHALPSSWNIDSVEEDRPPRWASDGRRVLLITDNEVLGFDRKIIQEHVGGDTTNEVFLSIVAPVPDDPSDTTDTEAWVDIVWIDGYFVLAAKGGQIFHSGISSTVFDQLDFARADVKADEIVGLKAFRNQLWVFGTKSIERWYNAGLPDFAFARDRSSAFDIGTYSRETLNSNELSIHFLGSDLSIYALAGNKMQKMSNDVVDRVIRRNVERHPTHKFNAYQYNEEGHKFVAFHTDIENGGNYWVYDWITRMWHERHATVEDYIISCVRFKHKTLITTAGSTRVRRMSIEYSGNLSGTGTSRELIMPIMQMEQTRARVDSLQFDLHYFGDDSPTITITLSWSDDGKVTYKSMDPVIWTPGQRLKYSGLGSIDYRGRHYRLQINGGNGEIAILGAYIEAEAYVD